MTDIPTVMSKSGLVPTDPATLRAMLVALVASTNPGYTANLPGSLIEDIASTDVGALVICDQARVEFVNSLTPYGANLFLLNQLGQIYIGQGFRQGSATNTSVFVVFTGTPGFFIAKGFTVSDGVHQYIVQDNSIIASGGSSGPVFCLASQAGSWAVPTHTVTSLVTSVPGGVTLSVTNSSPGTPGGSAQTEADYRAEVLEAGLAAAQGFVTYLRTQLSEVPGVQRRLIAVQQQSPGWKILVGGGDPYEVANAIFEGLFDVSTLVGSATTARNITVQIQDYPDTYQIVFVNPPAQVVTMTVTWNTPTTNLVNPISVAQLAQPALADYVNNLPATAPMNLFEMQTTFQEAIASVLPPALLTRMLFAVAIDGTPVSPESGTGIIAGDLEGYFTAVSTGVTVIQG